MAVPEGDVPPLWQSLVYVAGAIATLISLVVRGLKGEKVEHPEPAKVALEKADLADTKQFAERLDNIHEVLVAIHSLAEEFVQSDREAKLLARARADVQLEESLKRLQARDTVMNRQREPS